MTTNDEKIELALSFIKRCPIGWAIDSGFEALVRTSDGWQAHEESEDFRRVTDREAAEHLLYVQGFADHDGQADLAERMRTGELGGGS